jgi:hypothetical protein
MAASLAADKHFMSTTLHARMFLPCGPSDGLLNCAILNIPWWRTISLDRYVTAANATDADFVVATPECVSRWTSVERALYLGKRQARKLFLFQCSATSDYPERHPMTLGNESTSLGRFSIAHPQVHLVIQNCRPPLFRAGRDFCTLRTPLMNQIWRAKLVREHPRGDHEMYESHHAQLQRIEYKYMGCAATRRSGGRRRLQG